MQRHFLKDAARDDPSLGPTARDLRPALLDALLPHSGGRPCPRPAAPARGARLLRRGARAAGGGEPPELTPLDHEGEDGAAGRGAGRGAGGGAAGRGAAAGRGRAEAEAQTEASLALALLPLEPLAPGEEFGPTDVARVLSPRVHQGAPAPAEAEAEAAAEAGAGKDEVLPRQQAMRELAEALRGQAAEAAAPGAAGVTHHVELWYGTRAFSLTIPPLDKSTPARARARTRARARARAPDALRPSASSCTPATVVARG